MMRRVLPLVVVCVFLAWALPGSTEETLPARSVEFGVGMSVGLESGATSTAGLGVKVAVVQSLRKELSYGIGLDHLENGLQLEPSRRAEYNTTALSALLGWRVGGKHISGYVRSSIGAAYVRERLRATHPHGSWVLKDSSGLGPSGQVGGGVHFSLDEKAQGYIDLGVSQVWGSRSHTSGSLLVGVVTRR